MAPCKLTQQLPTLLKKQVKIQHCWELLVRQMLDGVGSDVHTDATTCFQTMSGHVVHYGKDTTHKILGTFKILLQSCFQHKRLLLSPWKPYLMHVSGPNNVGRESCANGSLRRSRNKGNVGSC